ncbi:MAG: oligosaccharide flippase family protein [Oscillospiraceae bacterium]|nr:oligosaccharide flippase family protein [Oscillospiraceae bacterium]
MPLYTRVLTTADYGIVDLIVQTANLLIPVVSAGISNSVIRFGLDRSVRKSDVFSTGLRTVFTGFLIFLLLYPFSDKLPFLSEHTLLIYLYVLASCLRGICSQFTKSLGLVRLYAFDGIFSTFMVVAFNITFLVGLGWGITGYILSTILSDFLSSCFLFSTARLYKFVKLNGIKKSTRRAMLRYSVPLIPTTIFWWITNVSDRYLVSYMLGSDANGLYAVSYKIPTIVILISGIFIDAWQISAVSETDRYERERFFTKVFGVYQSIVFLTSSGLIAFCKLITMILVSEAFYPSWQYIPFLVMSTAFSCFVTFLGTVYMVEKCSVMNLATTIIGAVINLILNIKLIPVYGVTGAAFATFFSYFAVFFIRAVDTRRFLKIDFNVLKLSANLFIITVQSIVIMASPPRWILMQAALVSLMFLLNFRDIMLSVYKLLGKFLGRKNRRLAQ